MLDRTARVASVPRQIQKVAEPNFVCSFYVPFFVRVSWRVAG